MLPMLGPWVDTERFTNVALLEKLGQHNRDVAVGVLANKNIAGPALVRIAENANLVAANVEALSGGAAIMSGRTWQDQAVIVMAALGRSEAGAKHLAQHLNPHAAAHLYRQAATTRFKGAAALRDSIRERVANMTFLQFSGHDGYTAAIDSVLGTANHTSMSVALRAAPLVGDTEALKGLAEQMSQARVDDPMGWHVDALLACTLHHPDVVAHWAEHGGAMGRAAAVLDHRQDPDMQLALVDQAPQAEQAALVEKLMLNPGVPYEARAQRRGQEFAAVLIECDATSINRMAILVQASRSLITQGQEFDQKTVKTTEDIVRNAAALQKLVQQGRTGALALPSSLMRVELLLSTRRTPTEAEELIDTLTRATTLPAGILTEVVARLPRNHAIRDWQLDQRLRAIAPQRYTAAPVEVVANPTVSEFQSGMQRPPGATEYHHPGAGLIAQRATSIAQVEAIYTKLAQYVTPAQGYGRTTPLHVMVDEALAAAPQPVDDKAMVELLGNALGGF